ncbi:MAG: amidohydrolase family protein, partial [Gemmatimonadetes bacterium]|nr:amidohydrolase family protein [Gemmatimonadota bacterium]
VRAQLTHNLNFIKTNATERAGLPETDPRKQLYEEAELRAIVEEAAAKGLGVAAHAHGDAGARAAVVAGVRSIEHGTYLSPETLRLMAQRGTYLVPTIAIVTDLTAPGGDYDDAALQVRGRHMLPRLREMVRGARAAGVKIVAATDTGYGPESTTRLSHELEELVAAGMTPLDALQSATTRAAELFGIANRTGRIAPGFEADLIVLERNPLDDIVAVQDVLMVITNGRIAVRRGDWPSPTT